MNLNCKLDALEALPLSQERGAADGDGDGESLSSLCGVGRDMKARGFPQPSSCIHASHFMVSTGIIIFKYIFKLMERYLKICWDLQALKRGFKESNWLCLRSDTFAQFSVQESIKNSKEKWPKCI